MNKKTVFSRAFLNKPSCLFLSFSSSPTWNALYQSPCDLKYCIASLQMCAPDRNIWKGKQLHSFMVTNGFLNSPLSTTSLINMYSKCNHMDDALRVFNYPGHDRNVFAYNAIISGFFVNEQPDNVINFYRRMKVAGVMPDKFTFPCVISACCDSMDHREVKKIHGALFKFGLELDIFISSALVKTYLNSGLIMEALAVFEELHVRDVVLWNSMVNGYAQIGQFNEALNLFHKMREDGIVPSRFTVTGVLSVFAVMGDLNNGWAVHGFVAKMGYDSGLAVCNALIDMYGKCKYVIDALSIFEMMHEKDIYSWNSIISVYEQCGDYDGALVLFRRMLRDGFQPDLVTLTTVLPACSHLAALAHGREIHGCMIVNGFGKEGNTLDLDDVLLNNSVMDMYTKCGNMRNAQSLFDVMRHKDVASWNIMIMGFGMHGYGAEALEMFSSMCEVQQTPDEVTFVGVLSACSHAGLVKQGYGFFTQMKPKYGILPTIEHYTCVIDMLGRAGKLDEAYELVLTMPMKANPVVWRALLAACRLHRNMQLAEVAARQVIELEPGHCGSYVLMSNIYGVDGRYEEVSEVRHTMRQHNVKKAPGCSWIELKNGLHVFITGDRKHPETDFIYASLNLLNACVQEHGYGPGI